VSNDLKLEIEQLKAKNYQLQKVIDNLDINIYKALHFAIFNDGEDHDENHDKSL